MRAGIWSGSIDTGLYTPELVAGTHFVGVEAFDNENKKWTEYKDYSTPSDNPTIKWVFETGDSIQSSATINEAMFMWAQMTGTYIVSIVTPEAKNGVFRPGIL